MHLLRNVTTCRMKYTTNQKRYIECLKNPKPLLVVEGPAGTGKTMLACEISEQMFFDSDNKYVSLIMTRPLVSVEGENIGHLPGTMGEKTGPWSEALSGYMMENNYRFQPLGFMRGQTYDNTIIIADEMQNSTPSQMLMLLTRIGYNSKLIITGDALQSDLKSSSNGLRDLTDRIQEGEYSDYIKLNDDDIKRSGFVKYIYSIYTDDQEYKNT